MRWVKILIKLIILLLLFYSQSVEGRYGDGIYTRTIYCHYDVCAD